MKPSKEASDNKPAALDAGAERLIPLRNHRLDSGDLFQGTKEITVAHGAETYRLRLTAQNKLILTK